MNFSQLPDGDLELEAVANEHSLSFKSCFFDARTLIFATLSWGVVKKVTVVKGYDLPKNQCVFLKEGRKRQPGVILK